MLLHAQSTYMHMSWKCMADGSCQAVHHIGNSRLLFFPFFSLVTVAAPLTFHTIVNAFHRCHPPTPWFDEQGCPLSFLFLDCSYNSQEVTFPVECYGISWTISMPEVGIVLRFAVFRGFDICVKHCFHARRKIGWKFGKF